MAAIPTVRASAVQPVAAAMAAMNLPVERHLDEAHLPPAVLEDPNRIIAERALWSLFQRVRDREGIEDFGFRVGASHRVVDIENLGVLLSGLPTLDKTLSVFCGALRSHSNSWDYWVEHGDDSVRLCRAATPIDVGRWPVEQYVVSYLVDIVRMAASGSWWPDEIWPRHSTTLLKSEAQWLRGARVHLGGPVTAIAVPARLLSRATHGESCSASIAGAPAELPAGLIPAFRQVISAYLADGRARVGELSDALGLTPRTLQRRLQAHGTTFQEILDEARCERASSQLRHSNQPIMEIAFELGYEEPSTFSRSFRRWTGVSPRAYRRANDGCE